MCGSCLCVCACCVYIALIMPCEATSHRMLQLPYVQVCYRPPLYTIKHAPACNMAAVLASEQLTALFVSNVSCPAAGYVCYHFCKHMSRVSFLTCVQFSWPALVWAAVLCCMTGTTGRQTGTTGRQTRNGMVSELS